MASSGTLARVDPRPTSIDARFDHGFQRFLRCLGAHIVLIKPDANVLRILSEFRHMSGNRTSTKTKHLSCIADRSRWFRAWKKKKYTHRQGFRNAIQTSNCQTTLLDITYAKQIITSPDTSTHEYSFDEDVGNILHALRAMKTYLHPMLLRRKKTSAMTVAGAATTSTGAGGFRGRR